MPVFFLIGAKRIVLIFCFWSLFKLATEKAIVDPCSYFSPASPRAQPFGVHITAQGSVWTMQGESSCSSHTLVIPLLPDLESPERVVGTSMDWTHLLLLPAELGDMTEPLAPIKSSWFASRFPYLVSPEPAKVNCLWKC